MKRTMTLKKNYEFKRVLTKGKYFSGKYIETFITQNKQEKNNIGIAIGVKLAKANKRNRIKRLVRENYRLLESRLKVGYNIIFLWKKKVNVEKAEFKEIKKDMLKIFQEAGILLE